MSDTGAIGYGIVGCGNISRFHFAGLEAAGARVMHVADVNERAGRPWADRTGARFSADYRRVIDDPRVTVVSVLTSAKSHAAICAAALAAGKDVICEKTMGASLQDAAAIHAAARESGRLFFTAYMKRFFPATLAARDLLPSLGGICSAQARAYQNWGEDFHSLADASKHAKVLENYGGAVLKCAGSHMLDMTMHLLGRPASVMASIDHVSGSLFDRRASAVFELAGGAAVQFEACLHSLGRIGMERNGWEEWIEITGTRGRLKLSTVMWDHPLNNGLILEHYDEATGTLSEHRFPPVNPFDLELAAFNHALSSRTRIAPNEDDGYAVDSLIHAMETSAREGKRVVPDFR
jgi:predicted dehydrogenase